MQMTHIYVPLKTVKKAILSQNLLQLDENKWEIILSNPPD